MVVRSAGLPTAPPPPSGVRTAEERLALVRRIVGSLVDSTWIEANGPRFDVLFRRAINPAMCAYISSRFYHMKLRSWVNRKRSPILIGLFPL